MPAQQFRLPSAKTRESSPASARAGRPFSRSRTRRSAASQSPRRRPETPSLPSDRWKGKCAADVHREKRVGEEIVELERVPHHDGCNVACGNRSACLRHTRHRFTTRVRVSEGTACNRGYAILAERGQESARNRVRNRFNRALPFAYCSAGLPAQQLLISPRTCGEARRSASDHGQIEFSTAANRAPAFANCSCTTGAVAFS